VFFFFFEGGGSLVGNKEEKQKGGEFFRNGNFVFIFFVFSFVILMKLIISLRHWRYLKCGINA